MGGGGKGDGLVMIGLENQHVHYSLLVGNNFSTAMLFVKHQIIVIQEKLDIRLKLMTLHFKQLWSVLMNVIHRI